MVSGLPPGKLRGDLNGREVDLRQRRDRQQRIGDEADEQDAAIISEVRDRVANEGRRDPRSFAGHLGLRLSRLSGVATMVPGCTRILARLDHLLARRQPLSTTERPSIDARP